jgi:transcriptional regulator with XRE-family HTH domain
MLNITEFIKIVLKKKNWTNQRLCDEINKIEEKIGDKRTSKQNITNYLNGYYEFGPKTAIKYEKALNLEQGTLLNMIPSPKTKNYKKEIEEFIKKIYEVR